MIRASVLAISLAVSMAFPALAGDGKTRLKFYNAQPAFPKQKNGTITLDYMPGGVIGEHQRHAKLWVDQGYRVIIRDDQYSAAAIMVMSIKKAGGRICAKNGADLYFHDVNVDQVRYIIGSKAANMIADAPARGWKRVSPASFGIGRCK